MKSKEIRQLSDEELQTELTNQRRHLFDLRSQAVTEKLENPVMLTDAKKNIARILTEINARQQQALATVS